MRYMMSMLVVLTVSCSLQRSIGAETINTNSILFTGTTSHYKTDTFDTVVTDSDSDDSIETAIWPFNSDNNSTTIQPKSTRKAFFLSFLVPGLGEAYVGSKRSIAFLGVEAVAWWLYLTNTNEGNDLEDDFQAFADTHWNYVISNESNDPSYWEWVKYHFREVNVPRFTDPNDLDPFNHTLIDSLLEETVTKSTSSIHGYSVHSLPSTKTQQYYEMIGKYPQFVYGWEDVDDTDKNGDSLNPTVVNNDGTINYAENIRNITSPLRMEYEDMRKESNDALKSGQRGIYLMILNRVVSAIHAARLAYNHNQKIDSELSQIKVQFVQKQIIDNRVPMLMVSKKF